MSNYSMLDDSGLDTSILDFQDGATLLASEADDCSPNLEIVSVYSEDWGKW